MPLVTLSVLAAMFPVTVRSPPAVILVSVAVVALIEVPVIPLVTLSVLAAIFLTVTVLVSCFQ
jgi:hypothetical protein